MKPQPAATPSGFFVLRTPLLPFTTLTAWGDGRQAPAALRARTHHSDPGERYRTAAEAGAGLAPRPDAFEVVATVMPEQSAGDTQAGPAPGTGRGAGRRVPMAVLQVSLEMLGQELRGRTYAPLTELVPGSRPEVCVAGPTTSSWPARAHTAPWSTPRLRACRARPWAHEPRAPSSRASGPLPPNRCGPPGPQRKPQGKRASRPGSEPPPAGRPPASGHSHPDWPAIRMASTRFRAPNFVMMLEI